MPRQAHGRSVYATGPLSVRKKKLQRGKALTALETAEKQFPEKIKIRQHRLGEAEDDSDDPKSRADIDERSAKRRKIKTSAGADDSVNEGSDLEGNHWHVGVEDEDEDSDIDSEDAFGESDEERFSGFTFRGSAQHEKTVAKDKALPKARRRLNLTEDDSASAKDLGESDDDANELEGDDLGEDAIDLAMALDMNEEEAREEQETTNKRGRPQRQRHNNKEYNISEESALYTDEADSDEADGDDTYSELSVSEDEANDETTTRLRSFVNGLIPAEKGSQSDAKLQRKLALPDKPSQFGLPSVNLSAADLLQYVKDPIQRQSLKMLQAGEREEPLNYKGGIPGKLTAPLAKRQQDRLDRVAAYDKSKETMERWVDTVKQNRRAEHLSFPLADPAKLSATNIKALQALDRSQPQSELEVKVLEIMQESGFQADRNGAEETQRSKYEELQEKKMPIEEVQARRRELRMQRELMFREEIRARRIKKIKSKAYRRVHRKEKDKFAVQERERLAAAGILNSDEERQRNERRRAEERMGARHRESKWAKSARASGQTIWNEDAKAGVSEMARRDDELRRRVEGKDVRESDVSDAESDSDSSYGSNEDDARWQEKLDSLQSKPQRNDQSKLANMAFMQKAEAARKLRNDDEIRHLQRMANQEGEIHSESDSEESSAGRQKYGESTSKPQNSTQIPAVRNEFEARLSEDEIDDSENIENVENSPALPVKLDIDALKSTVDEKQAKDIGISKGNPQAQPPAKAISKPARIEIKIPRSSSKTHQSELQDYTSPSESEHEQSRGLDAKDRLALDIFAGDDDEDLRKQFEKEKEEAVVEEGNQIVDNTLPGWGNWTGAGINKREQRKAKGRFLSTIKGVAPEARKDAKLERVIINEKRIKKNSKYMATELPHPFESQQQYERSLRLPIGPEWSTRNHFQDSIKPRILVKQGQVIRPMARPTA